MAASNAVTLFASVIFGATVFGETLSHGDGRLAPAIIGLAVAMAGIVSLAGAKRACPGEETLLLDVKEALVDEFVDAEWA